ncbi:hypothetical protein Glove_173g33 [Diversispora epigaea]|uniref:Uncharacterized protein n=1 Tax=Diversispora epigaea TaxID=1348612 RepID=A0A397IP89_9GLOM|nr:hypothetical protein Glove_173g33 [Diversispora epigaea]
MNTQIQKPDREDYIDPAATISTLASTASTLASIIDATAKTDNLYYVKLVISNFSQGAYMCESKNFCSLSAQMRFWSAQDLYSTAWSERAFCVSINNSDNSRLLVHSSIVVIVKVKETDEILGGCNPLA